MRFQIPQFVERETKIFGPLTFKQFLYLGGAGAVIFVLYFTLAKTNFLLFCLITIFLIGGALIFAFLNIGGRSLLVVLGNFLFFFVSSKTYLWRKGRITPKLIKLEKKPKKEENVKEGPVLKISGKGRLEKLSTEIETNTK